MLDSILDYLKNIIKSRTLPLGIIYLVLFSALVFRIFEIQIVEQEEIALEAEEKNTKQREIKATRGNIYDCNGVLLASNELSYTVTLEDNGLLGSNDEKNAMIHKLIGIIEENGGEIVTEFFIEQDKHGDLVFNVSGTAELRFKKNAYAKKSVDDLTEEEKNATAEEVYEFLRQGNYMFGISDEYSVEDTLKIMNVRYAMFMNTYAKYLPISIAVDVNPRTVAAIKENSPYLSGVEILQETHRVYNESLYMAHIMGYTGMVNESDMESDTDGIYNVTDQIGKTGLERAFEEYLRGTKGKEVVALNSSYRVTSVLESVDPVAGNDIYLTIDSEMQKAGYHILEKNLAAILLSRIKNSATAGNTSKTTASNLNIPIYDVYYALINNNIIDTNRFQDRAATDLERSVHTMYTEKEAVIIRELKKLMTADSAATKASVSKEMGEYLNYMYTFLAEQKLLLTKEIDRSDNTYLAYSDDKISLASFLQYAISMNWINLDQLHIGDNYYSTEELYELLMERAFADIVKDSGFHKMIYKTLVYSYQLSGRDICLLLYDQGVIGYDEEEYRKLAAGVTSAYDFIRAKIESLEITPADLALDPCSGAMVVTDPNTGELRALISYPSYDNNMLANRIDADYYSKLVNDLSLPLTNRPTQFKAAPGSNFKMISAIAAIEEGVVGEYEKIYDKTVFRTVGSPATCWTNHSHGDVDIRHAIGVSCNYFFYEMGYRLSLDSAGNYNTQRGLDKLTKYAAMFGLAEGETSGVELYEYEPNISTIDAIRSSIGQGSFAFTPTQISRYIGTIANGGTCKYLTLIDRIESVDGTAVKNTVSKAACEDAPKVEISDKAWNVVKDGMDLVINGEESTSKKLFEDLPVKVVGKTGTAQLVNNRGNHAFFTSYAPYEDPEMVVTVVLPFAYTASNSVKTASDFYHYYYGTRDVEEVLNEKVDANDASYNNRVTN